MSTSVTSPRPVTAAEIARRPASTAAATTTSPAATPTAATTQATAGAQAAQPSSEPFNAPMLRLPESPTAADVLTGLAAAMADPTVNRTSAQQVYQLHEQLMNAERSMTQVVLDGVVS